MKEKRDGGISGFFSMTRGHKQLDVADILTYLYLLLGTLLMFGPVIWIVFSSFKTEREIFNFPPRLLPYQQEVMDVEGYDEPLPLFEVTMEDGSIQTLARVRRVGLEAQMVDPANPEEIIRANNTENCSD